MKSIQRNNSGLKIKCYYGLNYIILIPYIRSIVLVVFSFSLIHVVEHENIGIYQTAMVSFLQIEH